MLRIPRWIKLRLDSWEQICFDDSARLRFNLILFTFTITCIFLIMSIRTAAVYGFATAAPTIALGLVTAVLFCCQFFRRQYSAVIAWLFGAMSLAMAFFFLHTGGILQYSHLWIYLLPVVGTMMVTLPGTLVYNGILLLMCMVLLWTPLHQKLLVEYTPYFRTIFPLTVLFLMLCNYVAEFIRHRTRSELVKTANKLRDSAFTDPLTGTYNRRALAAHFGELKSDAYGLSFLILDLDFFKNVNDAYGHDVGDKMLLHIVRLIQSAKPHNALLYRWGGEEFLLVVKSSDAGKTENIAEEIRRRVEETPLEINGLSISITVSVGLYCAEPDTDIGSSISEADTRLYCAKKAGRNRIVCDGGKSHPAEIPSVD